MVRNLNQVATDQVDLHLPRVGIPGSRLRWPHLGSFQAVLRTVSCVLRHASLYFEGKDSLGFWGVHPRLMCCALGREKATEDQTTLSGSRRVSNRVTEKLASSSVMFLMTHPEGCSGVCGRWCTEMLVVHSPTFCPCPFLHPSKA